MRAAARYMRRFPAAFQVSEILHIPFDLKVACLFAAFGLGLTALSFALGSAAEVGRLLAAAG